MAEEPEEDESTEARFRRVQEELRAMELPDMPDDEVDARLEEIKGRGRMSMPEVPLGEEALKELERRTTQARVTHTKAQGDVANRRASDAKAAKGLGIGLAIAYGLIGLPILGLGIGFLLQKAIGGPWVAIGVTVGFVGGIAFAMYVNARESDRL